MKFEESRSISRQRETRSFAQSKNRYYPTRDELDEEITPNSAASNPRDTMHIIGRKSNKPDSSFRKPNSRRRVLLNESDESSPASNDAPAPREPNHNDYRRRGRDCKKPESSYSKSTQETIQPSYDEDSEEVSPDSRNAHVGATGNKAMKEDHRQRRRGARQNQWKQFSNLYDDASSEDSDSKSQTSTDSGSSYSSSSDDDDGFQLNANCMNALFSKDAENATNLIRCDKAGPSATEVQLKMTLPLPLQFMEGFDNLVPSPREFKSALKQLRYNGDRFAKKCEFDYSRLDEQVIIDDEFAGEVMPQFYKSLFESPTEMTSEGEDESKHQQENMTFRRKQEESALDVNDSQFRFPSTNLAVGDDTADSVVPPESLPSHILVGKDWSFVSSQGSFEITPFAEASGFDARSRVEPVPTGLPKETRDRVNTEVPNHHDITTKKMQMMIPAGDSSQLATQHPSSFEPTILEVMEYGGQSEHKTWFSKNNDPKGKHFLSQKLSYDSVPDNPSFDQGHISRTNKQERRLPKDSDGPFIDELRGRRTRNALSKFSTTAKKTTLAKKEWIPAKREQLDLVDQAYPSFEVPEDELPKVKLQRPKQPNAKAPEGFDAPIDRIPISVDYQDKSADKDLGTVYSDLTIDEDAFGKAEYPVVETLTLSDASNPCTAELINVEVDQRIQNRHVYTTVDIDTPSLSSGDELMGREEKLASNNQKRSKDDTLRRGQVPSKNPIHPSQTDTEEGPLDEVMGMSSPQISNTAGTAPTHNWKVSPPDRFDSDSANELEASPNEKELDINPVKSVLCVETRHSIPTSVVSSEHWRRVEKDDLSERPPMNSRLRASRPTFTTESLVAKQSTDHINIPPILTPVASIDQCASTEIPMDELKDHHQAASGNASQTVKQEESAMTTGCHSTAAHTQGQARNSLFSRQSNRSEPDNSTTSVADHETENSTSGADETDRKKFDFQELYGKTCSVKNILKSDFSSRLKNAAAARLDALNDSSTIRREALPDDEESREEINQGEGEPEYNDDLDRHTVNPDVFSDEKEILRGDVVDNEHSGAFEEEEQESDIFEDAACQDSLDNALSEDGTTGTASENDRVRFFSEVDARSHAVEINYIGEQTSRFDDSRSLATEPPLVIAPTTTTLETPLSTAYTMLTVDTPVESPPVGSAWDSNSTSKKSAGSRNDFYETEHDSDDYHFDERLAKLSALLPASRSRKGETREVSSLNLAHLFVNGMTAIVVLIVSWLKHISGLQKERRSTSKAKKGEPNFRGYQVALDFQSTSSQRIQGSRHFPHELSRMEQEAGTFIDFIVPDLHGSGETRQHPAIWSVNSSSQSSRRAPSIAETYSSIRKSFSRGDAKSVASMKGWSAESDLCYTEFREE